MKHTKGPWHIWLRNENGMLHVGPPQHSVAWIIVVDDDRANAERIVATINACDAAGLTNEQLESGVLERCREVLKQWMNAETHLALDDAETATRQLLADLAGGKDPSNAN